MVAAMNVRMRGCYTDCIRPNLFLAALVALVALPLHAIDAGRADGILTIGGTPVSLVHAYAIGGQKNEANGRNDDIKIILTDKDGRTLAMLAPFDPDRGAELKLYDRGQVTTINAMGMHINDSNGINRLYVSAGDFDQAPRERPAGRTRAARP